MKKNILQARKALLALFAMLMPLVASAHDFEVGSIYYNITSEADKTAEVTFKGDDPYQDGWYSGSGSITIPATVTYNGVEYSVTNIGYSAFDGCTRLTDITLPESVTSIGGEAFVGCSSLTDITIPEGVTSIGYSAFSGCRSLTTITLPESVTSIGNYAFYDCRNLTDITIPEGVTRIGVQAFYYCSSLTDIVVAEGNQTYDSRGGCNAIIKTSSNTLIQGCSATIIPESVTSIGSYAFSGCRSLTDITLPESVTSIGEDAFSGCSSLTDIVVAEGNQTYDSRGGCNAIIETSSNTLIQGCSATIIPESVMSIGEGAFYGCSSLTAITLPESVTSIGNYAFRGCSSLESLHIGPNVDSYGSEAFAGCTAIKELTVMGSIMPEIPSEKLTSITLHSPIPLETKEFAAMVYRNATLNIPEGSLTRYQNADVWKNFWYVNEFDPKKGKDIFLTINQADNGYVKQHLTEGTVCTFTIVAAEGWKIHSVTFNGKEVTDQLTEEGTFTTPALSDDAVLNIAYEKIGDNAIDNASASLIKVQGHRGTLRITGTTEGDDISVYTTDGMLVAQESAEDDETLLTLPTGQVYIVTVADKVVKIGM